MSRPTDKRLAAWSEAPDCPVCGQHPSTLRDKVTGLLTLRCCDALVPPANGITPAAALTRWTRHVAHAQGQIDHADMARFGRLVFALLRGFARRMGNGDGVVLPDLQDPEADRDLETAVGEVAEDMGLCRWCLGVTPTGDCGSCDAEARDADAEDAWQESRYETHRAQEGCE